MRGLVLLLACVGLYGVMAYLTSQRVPEFGLRVALGATTQDVLALALRQSFAMVAGGIAIGAAAAWGAARILQHMVDGMQAVEPVTFAAMIAVLLAAALAASYGPARRASRVDPVRALRQD